MASAGYGYGQFGAGPNGEPIISRAVLSTTNLATSAHSGQTILLQLVDTYADGTKVAYDPSECLWWSATPLTATVNAAGQVTCLTTGPIVIFNLFRGDNQIREAAFTALAAGIASIVVTGTLSTLLTGQQEQLTAIGTYTDGTSANITDQCSWIANSPGAAVNSLGIVTGISQSIVNIVASLNGVYGILTITVMAHAGVSSLNTPIFRSHLTQVMQNYFDWKDSRIRRGRYTIDAQLLNLAAQQIEMSGLRLSRELGATTLHACPANIDNGGCYWKQRVPSSFNFGLTSHAVTATRSGSILTLNPYEDELPVPARVIASTTLSPVALANPLLFSATGIGNTTAKSWAAQRFGPFAPALVNRVHFWVDGPGYFALNIMVRITGQRSQTSAWSDAQATTSELVRLTSLGWASSKFAWSNIQQIQIVGLPVGVTLNAYVGMFSLPLQPDVNRPYADSMFRDVSFARYWEGTSGFLTEQYLESDYNGWRYVQSYAAAQPFTGLAVEPNTWGMFAASGTNLYYFDRREPLPSNLSASAISQEPYYGLDVSIDETQVNPIRFAVLAPVAYANALNATSYRFMVQTPDGNQYALTPDGFFAELTSTAGWRTGTPPTLTIPLAQLGTYVFWLQTNGSNGITQDGTPWLNPAFSPAATFDLSSLVSSIQGLSFDDCNRLWVWTGSTAVPLEIHYDGYVVDQASLAIYLTDSVDGLTVDGLTL